MSNLRQAGDVGHLLAERRLRQAAFGRFAKPPTLRVRRAVDAARSEDCRSVHLQFVRRLWLMVWITVRGGVRIRLHPAGRGSDSRRWGRPAARRG